MPEISNDAPTTIPSATRRCPVSGTEHVPGCQLHHVADFEPRDAAGNVLGPRVSMSRKVARDRNTFNRDRSCYVQLVEVEGG